MALPTYLCDYSEDEYPELINTIFMAEISGLSRYQYEVLDQLLGGLYEGRNIEWYCKLCPEYREFIMLLRKYSDLLLMDHFDLKTFLWIIICDGAKHPDPFPIKKFLLDAIENELLCDRTITQMIKRLKMTPWEDIYNKTTMIEVALRHNYQRVFTYLYHRDPDNLGIFMDNQTNIRYLIDIYEDLEFEPHHRIAKIFNDDLYDKSGLKSEWETEEEYTDESEKEELEESESEEEESKSEEEELEESDYEISELSESEEEESKSEEEELEESDYEISELSESEEEELEESDYEISELSESEEEELEESEEKESEDKKIELEDLQNLVEIIGSDYVPKEEFDKLKDRVDILSNSFKNLSEAVSNLVTTVKNINEVMLSLSTLNDNLGLLLS